MNETAPPHDPGTGASPLAPDGTAPRPLDVLVLTHYFPPELGAPQSRLGYLTRYLVGRGHRVQVLTSFPSYPSGCIPDAYRGRLFVREDWEGARVFRTWTFARPGHSLFRRFANQLSFTASSLLALPALERIDVVLVESPPIFLPLSGLLLRTLKRARLVVHVADLWVTAAVKLGYLNPKSPVRNVLEAVETLGYRFANAVITVSRGMIPDLTAKGFPKEKVRIIPNGVDTDVFFPAPRNEVLRRELGLEGKCVALFTGTHGLVSDMPLFVEVARRLRNDPSIHFLFVGDGVEKPKLVKAAQEDGLRNMTFLDPQPETRLAEIVNACDIGLSTLQPVEFTEHVIPVKLFLYMACGIPIVASDKEAIRAIVKDAGSTVLVPPGSPEALRDAIVELARDPAKRKALGEAGARFVARTYSRRIAARRTEELFEELTGGGPA